MTEEQLDIKMEEIFHENMKMMRRSYEKLKKAQAINLNDYEDNFVLPKIIMCALCKEAVWQWKPLQKNYEKEVNNLVLFI